MNLRIVILAVIGLLIAYLLLWPVPIDPVVWQPDPDPGLTGDFAYNDVLSDADLPFEVFGLGPEDVTQKTYNTGVLDLMVPEEIGQLLGDIEDQRIFTDHVRHWTTSRRFRIRRLRNVEQRWHNVSHMHEAVIDASRVAFDDRPAYDQYVAYSALRHPAFILAKRRHGYLGPHWPVTDERTRIAPGLRVGLRPVDGRP